MKSINVNKNARKSLRQKRVAKKLTTSKERPRLSVYKSNGHLYAQLIADHESKTLASSSTLQLKLTKNNMEAATKIGTDIANKALQLNIKKVAFDKGGSAYHGKVKALADAARAAGLEF